MITTTGNASTIYGKGNTTASGRSEAHLQHGFATALFFPLFPTFLFNQRVALAILFETNQTTYNMKQETFGVCLSAAAICGLFYTANEYEATGALSVNALLCLIVSIALAFIGNKLTNHEEETK